MCARPSPDNRTGHALAMLPRSQAMRNIDLQATWSYHNGTKHSHESISADRHFLDWQNQPLPFKIYQSLEPLSLSHDLLSSGVPALSAVSAPSPAASGPALPT